jgi:DNA-binding GntR family transcriptional regulator
MIPSEVSMAEDLAVSRGTVRAALSLLVSEGLIEVVPGRGRRVVGTLKESEAAWERVAGGLRRRLAAGEVTPSTPLPSEAALVAEFGVSRNTVRRAYRQLVDEGLVVIRHGAGAFPAPR